MSSIGERIRKRRGELKLSQEALARKVGCSLKSISRYERDKQAPRRGHHLESLAEALNVSAAWIEYGVQERDVVKVDLKAWTTERMPEVLSAAEQVIAELSVPDDVAELLRTSQWGSGAPSYSTLRSYAVDLMGQRSGKLKKPPATEVELPDDAMPRKPSKRRERRNDIDYD
jgi:transcriptional regulator with XRE-family HTH domain